jgi:hypothetical protein
LRDLAARLKTKRAGKTGVTFYLKEVADDRRQIQYAADTLWPASNKGNSAIRTEFKIPPNKSLK